MRTVEYLRVSLTLNDLARQFQGKFAKWCECREDATLRSECLNRAKRCLETVRLKLGYLTHLPVSDEHRNEIRRCQQLRTALENNLRELAAASSRARPCK